MKIHAKMSNGDTAKYEDGVDFSVLHAFPQRELEVRWRDFLRQADCPSAYETPEYFLEPYWEGKRPFAIQALRQGEVVGVLTGLHLHDRVISGLPARPQLCITNNDGGIADILLKGLLQEAGSTRLVEVYSWHSSPLPTFEQNGFRRKQLEGDVVIDRKSTRLNSSHQIISYAVFCLKKKKTKNTQNVELMTETYRSIMHLHTF